MPANDHHRSLNQRLTALYAAKPYLTPVFRLYTPEVSAHIQETGTVPAATAEKLAETFSVAAGEMFTDLQPGGLGPGAKKSWALTGAAPDKTGPLESYRRITIGSAPGEYFVERIWPDGDTTRTAKLNSPRRPAADAEKKSKKL